MTDIKEYADFVRDYDQMSDDKGPFLGLAGETGELIDMVKKTFYHDVPLNSRHLKKEIGDVLFYLTAICNRSGFTLEEVMRDNMTKLMLRYPDGFTMGGGVR